jgi:transcriptional regulator with XRE-family HTH domain
MDLVSFRKLRELTQARLAAELGMRSKGSISMIENGERYATLDQALRIERYSEGAVPAADLVDPAKAHLLKPANDRAGDLRGPSNRNTPAHRGRVGAGP